MTENSGANQQGFMPDNVRLANQTSREQRVRLTGGYSQYTDDEWSGLLGVADDAWTHVIGGEDDGANGTGDQDPD